MRFGATADGRLKQNPSLHPQDLPAHASKPFQKGKRTPTALDATPKPFLAPQLKKWRRDKTKIYTGKVFEVDSRDFIVVSSEPPLEGGLPLGPDTEYYLEGQPVARLKRVQFSALVNSSWKLGGTLEGGFGEQLALEWWVGYAVSWREAGRANIFNAIPF